MKTKTILLLLGFTFAFRHAAQAQKGWSLEFSVELHGSTGGEYKVPVDVLDFYSPFVPMEKELRTGIDIGVDGIYFFNNKLGISGGIHYTSLGVDDRNYVWSYSGVAVTLSKNISMSYVKFPVQVQFVASPAQKTSFIMEAGFCFSFLTGYRDENRIIGNNGATITLIAEDGNIINTYSDNTGSQTETAVFTTEPFYFSDVGGILGLGIQFQLSEKVFLPLTVNCQKGFSNVKNKSSYYIYDGNTYLYWDDGMNNRPNLTLDYTNTSFGIKAGVKINL